MRVRLQHKPKPNNYTESCGIDVAGGWRGRNVVVPGEICMGRPERGNRGYTRKAALNMQKSAEAIVPGNREGPNQCKPE